MNDTISQSQPPDQEGRAVTEIVLHALFVTATTAVAARYLATLRSQPRNVASYHVFATVIIPTFALADLSIAAYRTLKAWQRTGWENTRDYYLCAALDMRAVPVTYGDEEVKQEKDEETPVKVVAKEAAQVSVPLHLIPYQSLEPQRQSYKLKWFTQMAILSLYSCYVLYTDMFWVRRTHHHARTFVDDYVAITSFTGLVVALVSMSILSINTKWQAPERYTTKFQKYCTEPSPVDLFLNIAFRTVLVELEIAFATAIFLLSIVFFTSGSGFTGDIALGASCDKVTPIIIGEDWINRAKTPTATSHGLKFIPMDPRPCHSWNEGGIGPIVALFADLGYDTAFIFALQPPFYLVAYALCYLCPTDSWSQWMGHRFIRKINVSGIGYAILSWSLACIAVWEIASPRAWEPWMWRDPWSSMSWTI